MNTVTNRTGYIIAVTPEDKLIVVQAENADPRGFETFSRDDGGTRFLPVVTEKVFSTIKEAEKEIEFLNMLRDSEYYTDYEEYILGE